jgi:hypothetical protein
MKDASQACHIHLTRGASLPQPFRRIIIIIRTENPYYKLEIRGFKAQSCLDVGQPPTIRLR